MLVRKIMETAAALAGRGDLADFLGGKRVADVSAAQRDAETMLRCFNLAENEAASDYLPLVAQQTFPSGGPAVFGDFEKPPLEILWVKDGTGRKLPFSVCGEGVRFPSCAATVGYRYRPLVKDAGDETDFPNGENFLAAGAACEFCLMEGMFERAALLDKRYKESLAAARRDKSFTLKGRKWI